MGRVNPGESRVRRIGESVCRVLVEQAVATARRPWRLLRWHRLLPLIRSLRGDLHGSCAVWEAAEFGDGLLINVTARDDYDRYVRHQREKVRHIGDAANRAHFLRYAGVIRELECWVCSARSVLCLGARRGAEVAGFRRLGLFAWGIDLEPLDHNPYVAWGDFHSLCFVSESIDCVFTNSLDHSLRPAEMLEEVHRVLTPGGLFILQAANGSKDDPCHLPGPYEVFWWERIGELVRFVTSNGFEALRIESSTYPHVHGATIVFRRTRGGRQQ